MKAVLSPALFRGSFKNKLAFILSTGLGSGLSPVAPGTFGSLLGLGIAWKSSAWPLEARIALLIALTAIATWAATLATQIAKISDHPSIVADEVVGMFLVCLLVDFDHPWMPWAAFGFFRLFDILKPFPISAIDRWSKAISKKSPQSYQSGFGIVADDIAAGAAAMLAMIILGRSLTS